MTKAEIVRLLCDHTGTDKRKKFAAKVVAAAFDERGRPKAKLRHHISSLIAHRNSHSKAEATYVPLYGNPKRCKTPAPIGMVEVAVHYDEDMAPLVGDSVRLEFKHVVTPDQMESDMQYYFVDEIDTDKDLFCLVRGKGHFVRTSDLKELLWDWDNEEECCGCCDEDYDDEVAESDAKTFTVPLDDCFDDDEVADPDEKTTTPSDTDDEVADPDEKTTTPLEDDDDEVADPDEATTPNTDIDDEVADPDEKTTTPLEDDDDEVADPDEATTTPAKSVEDMDDEVANPDEKTTTPGGDTDDEVADPDEATTTPNTDIDDEVADPDEKTTTKPVAEMDPEVADPDEGTTTE